VALIDKIKGNKILKKSIQSAEEKEVKEFYNAGSITLNLLLSGKCNGGVPRGKLTLLGAPPAHMKTIIALISASDAQKKGCTVIWIDSEFAFDKNASAAFGLDCSDEKLILIQDNSIENIQSLLLNIFENYDEKSEGKVFIVLDSLGTLITSKTMEDSLDGKNVQDMTVSRKKNNFMKLLLGITGRNDITAVVITHTYNSMSLFSNQVLAGGTGAIYTSSTVLQITSRAKVKDGNDIIGYSLTGISAKGRLAKENSKLKFLNNYDSGINAFYGLLDDALQGGYVEKPSNGWYIRPCIEDDKKWREAHIYVKDFWLPIFKETDFKKYLEKKYSYTSSIVNPYKIENVLNTIEKDEK